jgi:N-acetylglutamate synthase-like GNAT family acetyltransferase
VDWSIAPYADRDRDAVAAFILGIQRGEFGLPIGLEDQPDLLDIPGFYVQGAHGPGGFWAAREGSGGGGAVLGTLALLNIGGGQGALRKMFVAPAARGSGLAAALLAELFAFCAGAGVAEVFLGTTDRYLAAHRFYAKHGFTRIDKAALPPSFPVMAVDTLFFTRSV